MNMFYGDLHITGNFTVNGNLRFREDMVQEPMLKYHIKGDLTIDGDITIIGNVVVGGSVTVLNFESGSSNDNQSS